MAIKWGDCRWGYFTWGGASCTVAPTFDGRYLWVLEIAWDGSFSGANEAPGRMVAPANWHRGKPGYVNRNGTGLEPIYAGELSFTLENYDGRYDPYNPSSVLYGKVPQGLPVRLAMWTLSGGDPVTRYPVFSGYIKDIQPVSGGPERVTVTCADEIETLSNQEITSQNAFNVTASAAIETLLDLSGISNYQVEASDLPLTLFSVSNANAMQEIHELTGASLGEFFVDREGVCRYYDLSYSGMASHTITQADVLKEFSIAQPWDTRRTHIKIAANRWVKSQIKYIWQSPQDIALTPGQTKTFDVEFSGPCEVVPLDPKQGDYSLAGIGYLGRTTPWVSVSLSNITANGCTVTMTNSGTFNASSYVKIRGREYKQSYPAASAGYIPWQKWVPSPGQGERSTKVVQSYGDDTIPQRNRSYMRMDSRYMQDANFAALYASLLYTHLVNGAKNPTITLQTNDPAQMFGIELLDKVHFTSTTKGIDNDYYLGQVEGEWLSDNGQDVRISYTLINHMQSDTTTAPEGINEVNDEPADPPNTDTGTPLPPDTGGECLNDAPVNGPFALGGTGDYYNVAGRNTFSGGISARARGNLTHANPTAVYVTGTASTTTDGITWTPTTYPTMVATLYNGITAVASKTLNSAGRGTFDFAGVKSITSVGVVITPDTPVYPPLPAEQYTIIDVKGDSNNDYPPGGDPGGYVTVVSSSTGASVTVTQPPSPLGRYGGIASYPVDTTTAEAGMTVSAQYKINSMTRTGAGDNRIISYLQIIYTDHTTETASGEFTDDGVWHDLSITISANAGKTVDFALLFIEAFSQSYFDASIRSASFGFGPAVGSKKFTVSGFDIYNVCPA